jgi:hypothetical protein
MNTITEHEALTNMAEGLGVEVHQKQAEDKRKTVARFFIQKGIATISPVMDYSEANHFLLGFRNAMKFTNK